MGGNHMGHTQKSEKLPDAQYVETQSEAVKREASQTTERDREVNTGESEQAEPAAPHDSAEYIHGMAIELKGIAESANCSFLAYLLDLVIEESAAQKRGGL